MDEETRNDVGAAIGQIPSGLFIITAANDEQRTGMLASFVQQMCFEPPTVCVAIAKGRPILPLISESQRFGLCQLQAGEKIILRKFASGVDPEDDPLLGLKLVDGTATGVPILAGVLSYLECKVTNHMDVDADHNVFIGRVVAGKYFGGKPEIRVRKNGFKY